MEETSFEAIPTFTPQRRQGSKKPAYLILIIVLIILLFLVFRGITSYKGQSSKPLPTPTLIVTAATPTAAPTPTINPLITPTISPVDKDSGLDRSQLSVTVQNGSGTAGVAGKGVT